MKKKQKRFMTLIELIIAMGLAMIILSTLTYFYHDVIQLNSKSDTIRNESFNIQYAENRLAYVLPQTLPEVSGKPFYFFTSSNRNNSFAENSRSLIFMY